jgi:hypothetical protein
MAAALDRIEAEYDPSILIFDMPPMFVSDDAMAAMGQMDCVLIIAAAETTKIKEIDRCEREVASPDQCPWRGAEQVPLHGGRGLWLRLLRGLSPCRVRNVWAE